MENKNTLSSVASPVNAPPLEGLFARVVNEETTAVVSPPSNVARDTTATNNDHPSTIGTKMVLKNGLIHDDPAKHSSSGNDVVLQFLKILENRGYDHCMGHGKKQQFIANINAQLHADDGPFRIYKITSDSSFLKKISRALKVLDNHLMCPILVDPQKMGRNIRSI